MIGGDLQRSQVCRTGQEWLDVRDAWQAAMLEKGWHDQTIEPAPPVPAERPPTEEDPPLDDAPVPPLTTPTDTEGG
jgi:hypothetical protein